MDDSNMDVYVPHTIILHLMNSWVSKLKGVGGILCRTYETFDARIKYIGHKFAM